MIKRVTLGGRKKYTFFPWIYKTRLVPLRWRKLICDEMETSNECTIFFEGLLGLDDTIANISYFIVVNSKMMQVEIAKLFRSILEEEIEWAVLRVDGNQCLGQMASQQCSLKIIRSYQRWYKQCINRFFSKSRMVNNLNQFHIGFIPKVFGDCQLKICRPISLCNMYRLYMKLMASRMKDILTRIVGKNQRAFLIVDECKSHTFTCKIWFILCKIVWWVCIKLDL